MEFQVALFQTIPIFSFQGKATLALLEKYLILFPSSRNESWRLKYLCRKVLLKRSGPTKQETDGTEEFWDYQI